MTVCCIDGCGKEAKKRSMCEMHYRRFRIHGDPLVTKKKANGAGYFASGYAGSQINGVRKFEHVRIAEEVLGKPLPDGAVVHHADGNRLNNAKSNLVICPNRQYHNLLHARIDALNESGNPDKRKCRFCKKYDNICNLRSYLNKRSNSFSYSHAACHNEYERNFKLKRNEEMTTELVIDIETIPDQTPGALEVFIEEAKANFSVPSTMTKAQACADLCLSEEDAKAHSKESALTLWAEKFAEEHALKEGELNWRKTSFDGSKGQIAVIGWKINGGEEKAIYRNSPESSDEIRLLKEFYEVLTEELKPESGRKPKPVKFIGHNNESFDLPFLFKRSVICKVKPCIDLKLSRYSENLYDTMAQWAGFGNRISLDKLCKALGIESPKQEIDGSKVWDYILAGKIAEVAEYCKEDVKATYEAYRRMTFAN